MPGETEFPKIVRRRSKVHGWGVFALESINKNTRIVDYAGELIDHKQSLRRETRYLKQGCIWCFTVNRRWVRDANVGGNLARFIKPRRGTIIALPARLDEPGEVVVLVRNPT